MTATQSAPQDDVQQLERLVAAVKRLRAQVAQRIVGQEDVVDGILTAVLAGGHALLIGVPGLAKTLMVQTVAEALELSFNRVQFTPDLMPSDITGTEIIEEDLTTGQRAFRFVHGPDLRQRGARRRDQPDAARRPRPRCSRPCRSTRSRRRGTTYHLPDPFFVLATQNPIEQEGTYPLPEAQLDRFMLELRVAYPSRSGGRGDRGADHRRRSGRRSTRCWTPDRLLAMQALVRRVPVSRGLIRAAVTLARMTRPADADAPALVKEYVDWGAGPRASQYLVLGAKARAAMAGRPMADLDDVRSVAPSVLRHRLVTNFAAEAADRTAEDLVRELVAGKGWLGG